MNNDEQNDKKDDGASKGVDSSSEKLKFGSLAPLTAAQVVTLLVGTSTTNTTYGGY